jgi:hypothetical protein
MSTTSDEHTQPKDGVVCPTCLLVNSPAAAFCADCGAPIGMVATIDPIQSIYAEGFAYRAAVGGPPKLIIVIGMWVLFGPTLAVIPIFLFNAGSFPETAFLVLLAIGSAVILYRTTRNYIVKSRLAREGSA